MSEDVTMNWYLNSRVTQSDLGECQSAYNLTDNQRLDCENETLITVERDNQISKLR